MKQPTIQIAGVQALLMSCIRTEAGIGSDIFLQQRLNLLLQLKVGCALCTEFLLFRCCLHLSRLH